MRIQIKVLLLFIGLISMNPLISFSQKAPAWFSKGSIDKYPTVQYFVGVGSGNSPEAAAQNARSEVVSQLRVTIESKTEMISTEVTKNSDISYSSMFENAITTTVNETVSGVQIVERDQAGDEFFAFAALNKSSFLSGLESELKTMEESITKLIDDAKRFSTNGKIVAALDNYGSALQQIPKFYSDKSLFDGVSKLDYPGNPEFSVSNIESELRDLLGAIQIEIISGNRQTAKSGEPLAQPIRFKVLYRYRGQEVGLRSVSVKAFYENNNVIDRVITDAAGEAMILAEAVPPKRGDRGEIFLEPILSNLPGEFRKYTQNSRTSARYEISDQLPIILAVDIKDKDGNSLDRVNDKVTRSLERLGHTIMSDAPLVLDGVVEVIEKRKVTGLGSPKTLVRAELSTKLKIASSDEVIGTFSSVEKGLSTQGEKAAMVSAYNRMKINRRDFSEFVARSSKKLESVFGDRSKKYLEEGKSLFADEKYQQAIEVLKLVVYGQDYVREARDLMNKCMTNLTSSMSGAMAGYMLKERIVFGQFEQGEMLSKFGESVVVKGNDEQESYASVFKDAAELKIDLPEGDESIAVDVRAKVSVNNRINQQFSIVADGIKSTFTFNQGYYRRASFGTTKKDIDRIREINWDNYGSNLIRFVIEKEAIKTFLNGNFFGAKKIESMPKNASLVLKLDQNDAIYEIKIGTK